MSETVKLTRAKSAAWDHYISRVNGVLRHQLAQLAADNECQLVMRSPTADEVQVIQQAMDDAKRDVASLALSPIIRALDYIDNSHSKSEIVKDLRVMLQDGYDELHQWKAAPPSSPPEAP